MSVFELHLIVLQLVIVNVCKYRATFQLSTQILHILYAFNFASNFVRSL